MSDTVLCDADLTAVHMDVAEYAIPPPPPRIRDRLRPHPHPNVGDAKVGVGEGRFAISSSRVYYRSTREKFSYRIKRHRLFGGMKPIISNLNGTLVDSIAASSVPILMRTCSAFACSCSAVRCSHAQPPAHAVHADRASSFFKAWYLQPVGRHAPSARGKLVYLRSHKHS